MTFFKILLYIFILLSVPGILRMLDQILVFYDIEFKEDFPNKNSITLFKERDHEMLLNIVFSLSFLILISTEVFANRISFLKTISLIIILYLSYYLIRFVLKNKSLQTSNYKDLEISVYFNIHQIKDVKVFGNITLLANKNNKVFSREDIGVELSGYLKALKSNNISFMINENPSSQIFKILNIEVSFDTINQDSSIPVDFKNAFIDNLKRLSLDNINEEDSSKVLTALKNLYTTYGTEEEFNEIIKDYT